MSDIPFFFLEGIVYLLNGDLALLPDDGSSILLDDVFSSYDDEVHVILEHLPPNPPKDDLWGKGCCYWQTGGYCPAGHHEDPNFLYRFAGQGRLEKRDEWVIHSSRGTMSLKTKWLEGHRCRVAMVPNASPEEILKTFASPETLDASVESLTDRAQRLTELLSKLRGAL